MRAKGVIILAVFLVLSGAVFFAENASADQWAETLGGTNLDIANAVYPTADGGSIVAGYTWSSGAGNDDAWVVKLSPDGTVTWQKTYGGAGNDAANSIQQTADGGYIVAGSTTSFGVVGNDTWVLKLSSDGTVEWQNTYGGSGDDYANSIQQTADGGYIVAGSTTSFGVAGTDAWVVKLNANGTVAWQNTYGGSNNDYAYSIQQTADGGYIVSGSTASFAVGGIDAWVLKLNADGSVAWQKNYGSSGNEGANSIQQTADGGYIVAGSTTSFGVVGTDAWVVKLNADGTVAWQNTYGGSNNDYAKSIRQTADGGFIVAGYTNSFGAGGYDAWLLKLTGDGAVAWQKTYGGSNNDFANSIRQTADGGYIVAGYTSSFGAVGSDFWVLKLDSQGGISTCAAVATTNTSVSPRASGAAGYLFSDGTVSTQTVTPVASSAVPATTAVVPTVTCSYVPSPAKWQNTYGGLYDDVANSIQQTADGGYIVAGSTTPSVLANSEAWVLKLNADGSIAWQKTYTDTGGVTYATSIQQTADGGYIVAGSTVPTCFAFCFGSLPPSYDWAAKLNPNGTVVWQNTYAYTSGDNYATSIQQAADGGYIMAGYSYDTVDDIVGPIITKLNTDGSAAWIKQYSGGNEANSIQQTADGGYIVAGYYYDYIADEKETFVMKLYSDGTVDWQKNYSGSRSDFIANSIQQTGDGGYILASNDWCLINKYTHFCASVRKLTADGTVAWQKNYSEGGASGQDYQVTSIQQTADGGYIIAGSATSPVDAWILKLNSDGTIAWQRTYGGSSDDVANSVRQTTDGGYIVAGYTASSGAGGKDVWVLKLDSGGGITGCGNIGTSNATFFNSPETISTVAGSGGDVFSYYTVAPSSAIISYSAVTPGQVCTASYRQFLLNVFMEGSGTGGVTSAPSGISCSNDCQGAFSSGALVTLIPAADPESYFAGWAGDCNSSGQVYINADKDCTATFKTIVDFSGTPQSGLASLLVNFADLSSNTPSGWMWSFGDGATSTLKNPTYTYLFPGTYSVGLSVTGPGGAGNVTKQDYINVNCGSGVQMVRLGTPPSTWTPYGTIQSAYTNASDGNYIEPMSADFIGDLTFDQNKSVTLKGGFSCSYSSNAAFTTVIGTMTVGGAVSGTGCVTVENIIFR